MPQVIPAVGAFFSGFAATGVGTFLTQTFAGRLLVSVASTALMQALQDKPRGQARPGLTSQYSQAGADNPLAFPLGTTATSGTRLCPWLSHGTNRVYLTLALAVSAVPGCVLSRVAVNGEWIELGGAPHPDYGQPCLAVYKDYFWIKWLDGSQTAADPMMLDKYGTDPDFPWSADMIGEGICIALLTFKRKDDLYNGLPTVVIETTGIPLYDPRQDDTAGGSGAHRWADPSTWEPSDNPMVQSYNVARGITLFTGDVWGGGFEDWRLPLDNWTTAMNVCDADEGGVPRYRAGIEVRVDSQPGGILKELGKASAATFAETAGQLKVRVDGPGLPVMMVSDGDFIVNKEQTEVPFAAPSTIYNGARSSYPEPEAIYASEDAPVLTDATFEAEDNGQRNLAKLTFHAVPYSDQVQRLQWSYVQDNRRQRRHSGSLQGAADLLEPLDTMSWSSGRYGYDGKLFEVAEVAHELRACLARVSLKEVDSGDWTPPPEAVLPRSPAVPGLTPPDPIVLTGWAVTQHIVRDAAGVPRRGGFGGNWSTEDLDGVDGVLWQAKDASDEVVLQGAVIDPSNGSFTTTEGVIPGGGYWVRARPIATAPTDWADWIFVQAPAVQLSALDFDPSIDSYIQGVAAQSLTPLELENMNVVERHDIGPDWAGALSVEVGPPNQADGDFSDGNSFWINLSDDTETATTPAAPGHPLGTSVALNMTEQNVVGPLVSGSLHGRRLRFTGYVYNTGDTVPQVGLRAYDGPNNFTNRVAVGTAGGAGWEWFDETIEIVALNQSSYQFWLRLNGPGTTEAQWTNLTIQDVTDPTATAVIADDNLILSSSIEEETVYFTDDTTHDLGAVFQSRVTGYLGWFAWNDSYTWDGWASWSEVGAWAGSTPDTTAALLVRYTVDDPADPAATWSDWAVPGAQLITARAYQFRVAADLASTAHHIRVSYATVVIDVPDRTVSDKAVAVPDTGLDYAFAPHFMDTPAVVASLTDPAAGERLKISAVSAEGVRFDVLDAGGSGVAGTINLIAKGYGRKET